MAKFDFITADLPDGKNFITSNGLQYRVEGERVYQIESFDVVLYHNNADHTQVDKTPDLTSQRTYRGTLRRGTSLVNPVITIQHPTTWFWNYMYIPEFQRYYFIEDVVSVNLFLWEIRANVDVLMTYRSGIYDIKTRVLRSESHKDLSITDTLIPSSAQVYTRRTVGTINNVNTWKLPPLGQNISAGFGNLIIKIAYSQRGISYTPPPNGYGWLTCSYNDLGKIIERIRNMGIGSDNYNLSDVILSAHWSPAPLTLGFKSNELLYSSWGIRYDRLIISDISNRIVEGVNRLTSGASWTINQNVNSVSYRNRSPFKSLAIEFMPFGSFPIDADLYGGYSQLIVSVETDVLSGDAYLYVKGAGDDASQICLGTANVAMPIDISALQRGSAEITSAISASLAGAVMGIPSGTFPSASISNIPTLIHGSPHLSGTSGRGSVNGLIYSAPYLVNHYRSQADTNPHTQGYYYNKDITLGSIWGYTQVADGVHIEGAAFRNCTTQERNEIEQLLTSGVILPKRI